MPGVAKKPCPCCAGALSAISWPESLPLVFSDCSQWQGPNPGLEQCQCGYLRKNVSDAYMKAIQGGYANYSPYHQGQGVEQTVFSASGTSNARSEQIVSWLQSKGVLRPGMSILDYGCGNGAFLKAISKLDFRTLLWACDIGDKHADEALSIPNVQGYHNLLEGEPHRQYDLISLIHVLEHFENPLQMSRIRDLLAPGGHVLIEIPNSSVNCFDLTIADHLSHFTKSTVESLLNAAGLYVTDIVQGLVAKELTVVASTQRPPSHGSHDGKPVVKPSEQLAELEMAREAIWRATTKFASFYIFGSSVAASWSRLICEGLGISIEAFLDEDRQRVGGMLMGCEIRSPNAVRLTRNDVVLVPLATEGRSEVISRLKSRGFQLCIVPG